MPDTEPHSQIPTLLNLPPEGLWAVPEEKPAEEPPFLRISASYAVPEGSGRLDHMSVEINADDVDARVGEDGRESGFIRVIVEAIAALRRDPQPFTENLIFNFAASTVDVDTAAALQDRLAAAQKRRAERDARTERERRYGKQGLPPEVVDRVFQRGGQVAEPGAAATDEVPAFLGGCTSGLRVTDWENAQPKEPPPYDNGGVLPPASTEEAHTLGHPGSDRWTGGDRKDGE